MKLFISVLIACFFYSTISGKAFADDKNDVSAGSILLELNGTSQKETSCQITFLMKNGLQTAIEDLTFELVLFDKQQQVSTILMIKSGALPINKTRVKRYGLKGVTCATISRLLVNDIKRCKGDKLSASLCLNNLKLISRTNAKLGL